MNPRVLAIVVHYRDAEATARCLRSLVGACDVVVVDQSGEEACRSAAREAGTSYIAAAENRGFAAGCNAAVARAGGDRLFFWLVNPDVVVEPDTLARLLKRAAGERVGAVAPDLGPNDAARGRVAWWRGFTGPSSGAQANYLSAACLLVSADAWREVGGMDERFFLYWEDVDLGLRLRAAGWSLAYAPEVRVHHERGTSVGNKSPVQDYYATRAALLAVRKHAPGWLPIAAMFVAFRTLTGKLARREWDRLEASAGGWRDGLRGTSGIRLKSAM